MVSARDASFCRMLRFLVRTSLVVAVLLSGCSSKPPHWTVATSGTTSDLYGVAFGGGMFVAVGAFGATVTSLDGASWEAETAPEGVYSFRHVWFDGTQFVVDAVPNGKASTAGASSYVAAPTRPLIWKPGTGSAPFDANEAESGGMHVRITSAGIESSPDGSTWTQRQTFSWPDGPPIAVRAGNGRFVAAGGGGTPQGDYAWTYTSSDGIAWTRNALDAGAHLIGLEFARGWFVTAAGSQSAWIATSANGSSWSNVDVSGGHLTHLQLVGDRLFAVGTGTILSADDPTDWTAEDAGTDAILTSVATGAGRYVAVGTNGAIVWRDAP